MYLRRLDCLVAIAGYDLPWADGVRWGLGESHSCTGEGTVKSGWIRSLRITSKPFSSGRRRYTIQGRRLSPVAAQGSPERDLAGSKGGGARYRSNRGSVVGNWGWEVFFSLFEMEVGNIKSGHGQFWQGETTDKTSSKTSLFTGRIIT
jgi:hypothetical protein